MKTLRQFLIFPLEILLFGVVMLGVVVSLMGFVIGYLCRAVEGEQ